MDLSKQIEELEKEAIRLKEKKLELQEKQQLRESLDAKLEQFFNENKFATPKDLAEAIIDKYGIKLGGRKSGAPRRKRTTITAELRDEIKRAVDGGESMNSVSKRIELSYAVVVKIIKGSYDHLRQRKSASAA